MNHEDIVTGSIHVPYNWTFQTTGSMLAHPVTASDEGKFARLLYNNSIWMLTDYSAPTWTSVSGAGSSSSGGKVVQVVESQTGSGSVGTTIIPFDDTVPQNTEGDEYLTQSITPSNTLNTLVVEVLLNATGSPTYTWIIAALFQDSNANALACGYTYYETATAGAQISIRHKMTAGTTSPTTFKVRAGLHQAGTLTLNGQASARVLGGVLFSSIKITEYSV